jgi:hypothetical protein
MHAPLLALLLATVLPVHALDASGAQGAGAASASQQPPAERAPGAAQAGAAAEGDPMPDLPADAFRLRLLELAFQAASAMPLMPHIKDRSQSQEEVVRACLELDQPRRALRYIEGIENWRKGLALAELAYYCADHGYVGEVQEHLDRAEEIAKQAVLEEDQAWRIDRIRSTIAKTHLALGHVEEAARYEAGLEESEAGRVLAIKALYLDAEGFEQRLKAVDQAVESSNFDQLKNALEALVPVFDRFYEDESRREEVQHKLLASWGKLPHQVRLDLVLALAEAALAHGDAEKARALVDEGQKVADGFKSTVEFRVPMLAQLSRMRARAGDAEGARRATDAALSEFERDGAELVDFRRPEVLRPVAEAYQALGHASAALMVYKRAVAEGALNPNLRPRAEDLASTCCSMALSGAEPDAGLWEQLAEIQRGLKATSIAQD